MSTYQVGRVGIGVEVGVRVEVEVGWGWEWGQGGGGSRGGNEVVFGEVNNSPCLHTSVQQ